MDELFAKNKSKKERTGLKERLWWQPAHEWCEANDVATDQTTAATDIMGGVEEAVEEEKSVVVLAQWGGGPFKCCLLYTSPSPRDLSTSRMPSSA